MVDSIQVLDAAWQMPVNPSTQLPYTDGIIYFFDAGTTTPKTVYSDSALSVSLGTSLSCNSLGYPVSSGNAKVLIYTGIAAYKIRVTSVTYGGTVFEADNVKGALDTSSFLTSVATADLTITTVTADRAITVSDKGKLLNVNCTSGTLTMTLDAATTLGNGFTVGIRHDGTANQVKITGNGTDTFAIPGPDVTKFSLTGAGEVVWIGCNGSSFTTYSHMPPLMMGNMGVITIADRLATPPASPTAGARYIVTSGPTGAWSTFAEHDIAEADGFGGWFKYTPPADGGWTAYVQDEDNVYVRTTSVWSTIRSIAGVSSNFPTEAIYAGALVAIIQDQQAQNSNAGGFTSGADQTRVLNTLVYNRNSVVSLSSNQFTLPAGTWEISWSAPAIRVDTHQTMLYSVTAASVLARGSVEYSGNSGLYASIRSVGSYVVTIGSSAAFEIRHRGTTTMAGTGFGQAGNFGTEVYTQVVIRQAFGA